MIYKEFEEIKKEYQDKNARLTGTALMELKKEYVFNSEKMEGNSLTLLQTSQVIDNLKVGGNNINIVDTLLSLGHYKALDFAINVGLNKYPITEEVGLKINKLIHKTAWSVDAYKNDVKAKGQKLGDYKLDPNYILIDWQGQKEDIIPPLREQSIISYKKTLDIISDKNHHIIDRMAALVYNIWLNQPFFDGNKRTARALSVSLAIKEDLSMPIYDAKGSVFNQNLIASYKNQDLSYVKDYINKVMCRSMAREIEISKNIKREANKNKGMGFLL